MSPITVGVIGVIVTFVLIFLRMPICLAFGATGFFGIWYIRSLNAALNTIATVPYAVMTQYVWTVMALFVFMGYLALHTKLAEEFYGGVRRWIGHFRGGLASAVILGNTAFGTVCGDIISPAVTFTTISLPEMRKYNYDDRLTLGSVAAGSFLSVLIPPSLGFIIYGAITQTSIGQLFMAGIFPGLILSVLYGLTVYIICRLHPEMGPSSPPTTWKEKFSAGLGMWGLIAVFVVIIGGIYLGLFTPTEAGGAGAFVVLIFGAARRRLNWKGFKTVLVETGETLGMVLLLIVGVMIFNTFLVVTGGPAALARFMGGISASPVITLLIITAIYFVLGMFIDAMSIILLTVPILYPSLVAVGVDPLQFGVVAVMTLAVGAVTPPYGIVIYTMSKVAKDVPIATLFRGVAPFIFAMIICDFIVVFWPFICTYLPNTMMK